MKPLIIYTLPRSRSNAALYSSKRALRIEDPLSLSEILPRMPSYMVYDMRARASALITAHQWQSLTDQLSGPDIAFKVYGKQLDQLRPAPRWWSQVQEQQSHDIFVLTRDRMETCLSAIIAGMFGYSRHSQDNIAKVPVTVSDQSLQLLDYMLEQHVRYFPTVGTLVQWPDLPLSHFDTQLNPIKPQNSAELESLITNIVYIKDRIAEILDWHREAWDAKENLLRR